MRGRGAHAAPFSSAPPRSASSNLPVSSLPCLSSSLQMRELAKGDDHLRAYIQVCCAWRAALRCAVPGLPRPMHARSCSRPDAPHRSPCIPPSSHAAPHVLASLYKPHAAPAGLLGAGGRRPPLRRPKLAGWRPRLGCQMATPPPVLPWPDRGAAGRRHLLPPPRRLPASRPHEHTLPKRLSLFSLAPRSLPLSTRLAPTPSQLTLLNSPRPFFYRLRS